MLVESLEHLETPEPRVPGEPRLLVRPARVHGDRRSALAQGDRYTVSRVSSTDGASGNVTRSADPSHTTGPADPCSTSTRASRPAK